MTEDSWWPRLPSHHELSPSCAEYSEAQTCWPNHSLLQLLANFYWEHLYLKWPPQHWAPCPIHAHALQPSTMEITHCEPPPPPPQNDSTVRGATKWLNIFGCFCHWYLLCWFRKFLNLSLTLKTLFQQLFKVLATCLTFPSTLHFVSFSWSTEDRCL